MTDSPEAHERALIAAGRALVTCAGDSWDDLDDDSKQTVLEEARSAVEAYHGVMRDAGYELGPTGGMVPELRNPGPRGASGS